MSTAFTPLVGLFGEEVIVSRASQAAHVTEARKGPRGLERDVYAEQGFGYYHKANSIQIKMCVVLSNYTASRNKREEGEVRDVRFNIKSTEPIYTTDDSRGDYADMVMARGELFKLVNVTFDRLSGYYSGQLVKVSDDFAVDSGVR